MRPSGKLFDTAGPRAQSRVTRDVCSTPRAIGLCHKSPRTAGRPHRPSDTSQSHPGLLVELGAKRPKREMPGKAVDPAGHGPRPKSPGTAGRTRGHSDPGTSRPGQLEDSTDLQTQPRVKQDSWSTPWALRPGPESLGGATPWALRHGPESSETSGRPCKASGTLPSCPGQLVDPAGHGPSPGSPGTAG